MNCRFLVSSKVGIVRLHVIYHRLGMELYGEWEELIRNSRYAPLQLLKKQQYIYSVYGSFNLIHIHYIYVLCAAFSSDLTRNLIRFISLIDKCGAESSTFKTLIVTTSMYMIALLKRSLPIICITDVRRPWSYTILLYRISLGWLGGMPQRH